MIDLKLVRVLGVLLANPLIPSDESSNNCRLSTLSIYMVIVFASLYEYPVTSFLRRRTSDISASTLVLASVRTRKNAPPSMVVKIEEDYRMLLIIMDDSLHNIFLPD